MSPRPARVHQLAEVAVLRDEYTPLAQRALHHLFPGYPLGGLRITPKAIWHMMKAAAKRAIKDRAPHDLRRTCEQLCHSAGGGLEALQFLIGAASGQKNCGELGLQPEIHPPEDRTT